MQLKIENNSVMFECKIGTEIHVYITKSKNEITRYFVDIESGEVVTVLHYEVLPKDPKESVRVDTYFRTPTEIQDE